MSRTTEQDKYRNIYLVFRTTDQVKERNVFGYWKPWTSYNQICICGV